MTGDSAPYKSALRLQSKAARCEGAMDYQGACHCQAIRVELTLSWLPEEAPVRSCDCSFCRAHGARSVTDPGGSARIVMADPSKVQRYRFALETADYIICSTCGTYVGAVAETPGGLRATINANVLTDAHRFAAHPPSVNYDRETAAERLARRARQWTPATIEA